MTAQIVADLCARHLGSKALSALDLLREKLASHGSEFLLVHFASLPRKLGRNFIKVPQHEMASGVRLVSLRCCDLGAADLLVRHANRQSGDLLNRLYHQGDALERRMILKSLNFLPRNDITVELLQEAHRTNDEELFRAAYADTTLAAEVLDNDDFYRGVLKSAFMNLEFPRLLGVASRATETLSEMLLEFMSEREAAGRKTWPGSLELAAHAPSRGVVGRIAGDLQHGDDARRYHAVRGAGILIKDGNDFLRGELTQILDKERCLAVRTEIGAILS